MDDEFSQVTIFPGEDEFALKSEFVRLMAKWRHKHSPFEIASYIFKGKRDPLLRANQVASHWIKDLELLDQIDEQSSKPKNSQLDAKEERLLVLKTIYTDVNASHKDKIEALKLYAQIEGEIKKLVENKTETNVSGQLPVFQFTQYSDG